MCGCGARFFYRRAQFKVACWYGVGALENDERSVLHFDFDLAGVDRAPTALPHPICRLPASSVSSFPLNSLSSARPPSSSSEAFHHFLALFFCAPFTFIGHAATCHGQTGSHKPPVEQPFGRLARDVRLIPTNGMKQRLQRPRGRRSDHNPTSSAKSFPECVDHERLC